MEINKDEVEQQERRNKKRNERNKENSKDMTINKIATQQEK